MSLELEHNGKRYRWVEGKGWGTASKPDSIGKIKNDVTITCWLTPYCISSFSTYHTPDQLVELGYMEEVKEPEWIPKINDLIVARNDWSFEAIVAFEYFSEGKYVDIFEKEWQYARQIPEPLQSEIKKLLNS